MDAQGRINMSMRPFTGRCHTCGHDHDAEVAHWRDVLEIARKTEAAPQGPLLSEAQQVEIARLASDWCGWVMACDREGFSCDRKEAARDALLSHLRNLRHP